METQSEIGRHSTPTAANSVAALGSKERPCDAIVLHSASRARLHCGCEFINSRHPGRTEFGFCSSHRWNGDTVIALRRLIGYAEKALGVNWIDEDDERLIHNLRTAIAIAKEHLA